MMCILDGWAYGYAGGREGKGLPWATEGGREVGGGGGGDRVMRGRMRTLTFEGFSRVLSSLTEEELLCLKFFPLPFALTCETSVFCERGGVRVFWAVSSFCYIPKRIM